VRLDPITLMLRMQSSKSYAKRDAIKLIRFYGLAVLPKGRVATSQA
jgi:hypothetical protein